MTDVDRILSGYLTPGTSLAWPGEREMVRDRGDREVRQQNAWDAATGDPNLGYGVRLPSPLASAREAVGEGARKVSDALLGWMTPTQKEQAAVASNFLGPAAPLAKAMFMTPGMVKNAGDLIPSRKGSLEAWGDARSMIGPRSIDDLLSLHYSDPALLSRIYNETGWMPPYTMSPHQDRPLAWHDTPVEFTPTAARKISSDGVLGTFDSLLAPGDAKDLVLGAAPWLKTTDLMPEATPRKIVPGGSTMNPTPGEWSGRVSASGPTLDDVMSVVHHELFHAGPQAHMRKLGVDTAQDVPKTAAEKRMEAEYRQAKRAGATQDELSELRNLMYGVKDYARYLNDPFEHLARVSSIYEADPRLVTTRPDLVNSFSDEGFSRISEKARKLPPTPNPSRPEIEYSHYISPAAPFYRPQPDK